MIVKKKPVFTSVIFSVLLSACAATPDQSHLAPTPVVLATEADNAAIDVATQLIQQGKHLDAALIYSRMATKALPPVKQELQLNAAQAMVQGGYIIQAQQLALDIDTSTVTDRIRIRKLLLLAEIDLGRGNAERGLKILEKILSLGDDVPLRLRYWSLKSDAYALVGNHLESARAQAQKLPLLENFNDRANSQVELLKSLSSLSDDALMRVPPASNKDHIRSWMELALIMKTYQRNSSELSKRVNAWRETNPQLGLIENVVESLLYRQKDKLDLPRQIALLLPFEGAFANVAEAVRDGFLAAFYANKIENFTPEVRVYDTGKVPDQIWSTYLHAVQDGAQMVIGPLNKNAVNILAGGSSLDVPVVALNYTDSQTTVSKSNFFQFSLSPEDEAVQAAERAWLDEFQHPLILFPQGPWGERVQKAFQERWEQLGGSVLESIAYDPRKNDFSPAIRKVLNLDASQERRRELNQILSTKVEFSPRRRQDADFIFLAAFPRQARLISPQLRFHHAADLPVYATSHVYSGAIDPKRDKDMDALRFGDMPWVLPKERPLTKLKSRIESLWPSGGDAYARFYALGVDAFNLIPHMNQLISIRTSSYDGETGQLYVDDNNRIYRRVSWVKFARGIPVDLDQQN